MAKSNEEILKTFKVELQGNDLILVDILEAETEEQNNGLQAKLLVESIMKIVEQNPGKTFNFLIDLTKSSTSTYVSAEAKKYYADLTKHNVFRRAAIIGRSLVLEVTVNILLSATGRGDSAKWFGSRDEAIAWLNSSS